MSAARTEALEILRDPTAAMTDVLKALSTLDKAKHTGQTVKLGIAANISVELLGTYLRRYAYIADVKLEVITGSYDDLLNDVTDFVSQGVDHVLVIPFFDNLYAAWESQLDGLTTNEQQERMQAWLSKLKLAVGQTASVGRLTLAGAHLWNSRPYGAAGELLLEFNRAMKALSDGQANAQFFDTAGIVTHLGEKAALDARFYYSGKAPYTPAFFDEFARRFALATRGFDSYFYKVVALDCDNTLWGGIVGEDGLTGIGLDPYDYPGNVFWTVQQQLRQLESSGVLLCLCTKNNAADVDEVFATHPNAVLKDEHFAAKRVNWEPKVANLQALAKELNLGAESFIFIDDSVFELEAVRTQLPQVRVFQVPKKLSDYPAMLRDVAALCVAGGVISESESKTRHYRQLAESSAAQANFANQEDYLRSLDLEVRIYRDAREQIPRIAELTQKSNQFNLTTRRYTPGEVVALMDRADSTVYSFEVSDRFGKCGVTGVIVVDFTSEHAVVDAFLMSCRVIGRGVEFAVWRAVLEDSRIHGKRALSASYLPTAKNTQVADFFDRLGLSKVEESEDGCRRYEIQLDDFRPADRDWVELIDG
ncbi:HAD-IIIC family phosphatase [Mycobacterium marseillense]|uniref:HAD-IIIC family phosphatase n=1 Tax=Mycobacterium marseillense TaxID=701042 RepID=UPI000A92AFCF|nr:HAD-IIIC family phosphatase [Mycobacterium marseillense]MCA2265757.1 HAD-IIIC family phosphatase [Mycobacterium marseillense]